MEIDSVIELIDHALLKSEEDRAFLLYANMYPHFTKENFIPFSQFFKAQKTKISQTPKEDILDKANKIREQIRSKGVKP